MTDTLTIPISLPGEFVSLLGTQSQAIEAAKEYIILGLYLETRISGGKAAELLGLTRHGFIALLARKGFPYFRYDPQDWEQEVIAIRQWQAERGASNV